MPSQILRNCIITHKDSEIVRSYDVYAGSGVYHVGVDIKADDVFTPCQCVVIYDGLVEKRPSITIQYSTNICLRFTHLKKSSVISGEVLEKDAKIGEADEFVHFEYLTSEQTYPNFRVFFNAQHDSYFMYKHNPYLVLEQNIRFEEKLLTNAQSITSEDYESRMRAFSELEEKHPGFFGDDESYAIFNSDLFDNLGD